VLDTTASISASSAPLIFALLAPTVVMTDSGS
jgi:hypothetical protein